ELGQSQYRETRGGPDARNGLEHAARHDRRLSHGRQATRPGDRTLLPRVERPASNGQNTMTHFTRRQFLGDAATLAGALGGFTIADRFASAQAPAQLLTNPVIPGDIEKIEHLGMYLGDCSLPGDSRADGVVPRHATCVQVARDRWLVLYS